MPQRYCCLTGENTSSHARLTIIPRKIQCGEQKNKPEKCSFYQLVVIIESLVFVTALRLLSRLAVRVPLTARDLESKTRSGFTEATLQ